MALQSLLLLLLSACTSQALLQPAVAATAASASSRAGLATMKHNDHFLRISRAEVGRMRLCVSRSNNHIYGQVIDDSKHAVLVAASTMEADLREARGGNCEAATVVGKRLAERAQAKGIKQVFFDRNGFKSHGRVKALGDAAREGGLDF